MGFNGACQPPETTPKRFSEQRSKFRGWDAIEREVRKRAISSSDLPAERARP
jgi:hypothetical protein